MSHKHASTCNCEAPISPSCSLAPIRCSVMCVCADAYKFCSPTRSAIQSGRNPIHVNVQNYQPTVWDYVDPTGDTDSGYAGISRNMTTLADIMKRGGYKTHFAGKWVSGASSVPVVIMLQQPHLVLASTFSDCVILCRTWGWRTKI